MGGREGRRVGGVGGVDEGVVGAHRGTGAMLTIITHNAAAERQISVERSHTCGLPLTEIAHTQI